MRCASSQFEVHHHSRRRRHNQQNRNNNRQLVHVNVISFAPTTTTTTTITIRTVPSHICHVTQQKSIPHLNAIHAIWISTIHIRCNRTINVITRWLALIAKRNNRKHSKPSMDFGDISESNMHSFSHSNAKFVYAHSNITMNGNTMCALHTVATIKLSNVTMTIVHRFSSQRLKRMNTSKTNTSINWWKLMCRIQIAMKRNWWNVQSTY